MSCPVTCTHTPAAIDAFANTYLFVVTVIHWFGFFFGLPFYMVASCGVTRYNFCCFLFPFFFFLEKAHQYCSFLSFLEFCNYMQYSHDKCHQPINQIN